MYRGNYILVSANNAFKGRRNCSCVFRRTWLYWVGGCIYVLDTEGKVAIHFVFRLLSSKKWIPKTQPQSKGGISLSKIWRGNVISCIKEQFLCHSPWHFKMETRVLVHGRHISNYAYVRHLFSKQSPASCRKRNHPPVKKYVNSEMKVHLVPPTVINSLNFDYKSVSFELPPKIHYAK